MLGMRMPELLLILLVVLIVFGAKSLPKLGSSLGEALRGFRRSAEGGDKEAPRLEEARGAAGPVPCAGDALPQAAVTKERTPAR
jgi:sec-independent protein translocase protein TatA